MALYTRSFFLSWVGRHEEAIAIGKRAVKLDPVGPNVNNWLGMYYFMARRYDEAIGQLNKVLALEPGYQDAHLWLCYSYAKKEMYEEAAKESVKLKELWGYRGSWWADARQRRDGRSLPGRGYFSGAQGCSQVLTRVLVLRQGSVNDLD